MKTPPPLTKQPSQGAHTPTPWRFLQVSPLSDGIETSLLVTDRDEIATVLQISPSNAAFIVTACNEYASLKASVEKLERERGALREGLRVIAAMAPEVEQCNEMALRAGVVAMRDEALAALAATQP